MAKKNPAEKTTKPIYVSTGEAARLLGVHVNTVNNYCEAGNLICFRRTPRSPRQVLLTSVNDMLAIVGHFKGE